MNLRNFSISDDLVGLKFDGRYLDLHNNFDFTECEEGEGVITLAWKRVDEPKVPEGLPCIVMISFRDVTYFDQRGKLSDTIDELGFFENSTLGRVEYNGAREPATGCEVLVFRYANGSELAIMAKSATMAVSNGI